MDIMLPLPLLGAVLVTIQLSVLVVHRALHERQATYARQVRVRMMAPLVELVAADATPEARSVFLTQMPPDARARREVARLVVEMLPGVRGDIRAGIRALFDEAGFTAMFRAQMHTTGVYRRRQAVAALGTMEIAELLPDMCFLLRDRSPSVRRAAAMALGSMNSAEATSPVTEAAISRAVPWGLAKQCVVEIGPVAAPTVIRSLDDWLPEMRLLAAELCACLWMPEAEEPLVACLIGADAPLRMAVVHALAHQQASGGSVPWAQLLADEASTVRAATAGAIGEMGALDLLPALTPLLHDPTYEVAPATAQALAQLGTRGRRELWRAAEHAEVGSPASSLAVEMLDRAGATTPPALPSFNLSSAAETYPAWEPEAPTAHEAYPEQPEASNGHRAHDDTLVR
jgi:hypothetical protein